MNDNSSRAVAIRIRLAASTQESSAIFGNLQALLWHCACMNMHVEHLVSRASSECCDDQGEAL